MKNINFKSFKSIHIKIALVLVLGFFISGILNREVFIANSPQVRENLGGYLIGRLGGIRDSSKMNIARVLRQLPEQKLEKAPLSELSKGVYAKSDENYSYTEIREGEVEWIEYIFNVEGKTIRIQVPKGQNPPTQEEVEVLQ